MVSFYRLTKNKRTPWICVLVVICIAVIINEFLCYKFKMLQWNNIGCNKNSTNCIKLLLVADPQILGNENERILAQWDSDRYLSKTFTESLNFFQPNIIIFLGDLMDEGSIASDMDFHHYLKRLFYIFESSHPVMRIWLPGDNDIGGESYDRITQHKLDRYNSAIQQPSILAYRNIEFYKINRLTGDIPKHNNTPNSTIRFHIALSHLPILFTPGNFVDQVLSEVKPGLIFSAHEHKSLWVETEMNSQSNWIIKAFPKGVLNLQLNKSKLYEILVPTCSYRMGVYNIGYGAAVIDMSNENLKYTVLWQPSRLHHLLSYVILIVVLFLLKPIILLLLKLFDFLISFLKTVIKKEKYRPRNRNKQSHLHLNIELRKVDID